MKNYDREFVIRKIRSEYTEKEISDLDELKAMDKKVKRPPAVFSYIFGSIGALVMGFGMSLIMTDMSETIGVAEPFVPGIVIGAVGLFMAVINYPIYQGMLRARRKKYAKKMIELSDTIMNRSEK